MHDSLKLQNKKKPQVMTPEEAYKILQVICIKIS